MEEQKIAKNRRQVIFTLADGSEVTGEVFLSLYEAHRQGSQRVGELLNGEDAFLPVKTADGTVHLNVANIIKASTPADDERHELMMLGKKYTVQITTLHGEAIEGEIFVDLPQDRSRVSDYLNRPERFFRVFVPGYIVYVGARFILEVRD
ncbi:MAG: hypothetical protein AB7D06_03550 [Pedobacter sp.]